MILSTLDINKKNNKTIIVYIIVTILLYIGSVVYLKLGHGVSSNYMKFVALIPLIMGVVVFTILKLVKKAKYSRIAYNLYNASVETFVAGSICQGILEICGGHSFLTKSFLIIGLILLVSSIIAFIICQIRKPTSN